MPIKFCFNFWSPGRAVSTRLIHYDDTTEKSCIRIVQVQLTYEFVSVRGHIYLEPFFWVCTLKLWPSLHSLINSSIQSVAAEVVWTRALIRLMNPRKNSSTKKLAEVDIYLLYTCKHNYRCCRSWFTLFYQIKFMFTTWQ